MDQIIKKYLQFVPILTGDFNIRLPVMEDKVKTNGNAALFTEFLLGNDLVIKNTKIPTFKNYNGESLVHYLLELVTYSLNQFDFIPHRNILSTSSIHIAKND